MPAASSSCSPPRRHPGAARVRSYTPQPAAVTRSVQVGDEVVVELPFSEVCMHLRVAGTRMWVRYLGQLQGVQLLDDAGAPFSAPITPAEAGFYHDDHGAYLVIHVHP
jgi:hypothetical protein